MSVCLSIHNTGHENYLDDPLRFCSREAVDIVDISPKGREELSESIMEEGSAPALFGNASMPDVACPDCIHPIHLY